MAFYAVIENGIVTNAIVADSKEIAEEASGCECIEYTLNKPVGVGYFWDGNKFKEPVVIDAPE